MYLVKIIVLAQKRNNYHQNFWVYWGKGDQNAPPAIYVSVMYKHCLAQTVDQPPIHGLRSQSLDCTLSTSYP